MGTYRTMAAVRDVLLPKVLPAWLLVRVKAVVAINPTD
ncbi:hypothetical protein MY11210_002096 [Beauveria gryllotalpidicola]